MNKKLSKLIVILGPTASGKTSIAVKMAKKFNGEIVCADSRTIYKWMNIGTAKPSKREQGGVKHHLIDVVYPYEEFGLADFKEKAAEIIRDIIKRGKVPFLVGGTGLYIDAIVKNLEIPNIAPDKKLRAKLEKESLENLLKKLKKLDPKSAEKIGKNKRKIIRALEVCEKTGKKFSELQKSGKPLFNTLEIGIKILRTELYRRINERAEKMIKDGMVNETKSIICRLEKKMPVKKAWLLPVMTGLGYGQIGAYLRGETDLNEALRLIQRNTRHYAKRQITWFRRNKKIKWVKNGECADKLIKKFLKK